MARNPKNTDVKLHNGPELADDVVETADALAIVQTNYSDERDLVNQLLGQFQMASAIAKFSDVISLTKLQYIKENKLYQHLKGKKVKLKEGSEISDVGTFEGFCQMLGLSYSKVHEDLSNLNAFGEQALEEMSRIGIGYRELRQYRKLPEDQKTALIEVAKAGDKEALVELAEEFIAKNNKEKEALKKEHDELKADYKALSKHSADITKEKSELNLKLNKYVLKAVPLDDRLEPFKKQIAETQSRIDELLEQQRQYVQLVDKLQKEIMENDPDYDPEQPYSLPQSLVVTLITLYQSLKLTSSQSKRTYNEMWMNFSDDIAPELGNVVISE